MNAILKPAVLDDVKAIVESTLKIPVGKLDIEAEFSSFGMDSIIAMELMTNLSKRLNITITPAMFAEVNNIRELASAIDSTFYSDQSKVVADSVIRPIQEHSVAPATATLTSSAGKEVLTGEIYVNRKTLQRQTARTRNRVGSASFQQLMEFINLEYSIDLQEADYQTIDQIVDALVTHHHGKLAEYYNLPAAAELKDVKSPLSGPNDDIMEDARYSTQQVQGCVPQSASDVAIVGLSCRFPDAPDANTFWNNLISRKSSIREIPKLRWDWNNFYSETAVPNKTVSKWGALIDDVDCFDAKFFDISPLQASLMDPQERLFLQEVYKAFQDAGIGINKSAGSKTGVFVGYEYAEYEHYLRGKAAEINDGLTFSSSSPTYYLANRLSFIFNFQGPSESINTNCASSAVAIHRAYYSLLNGECDTAVVGGVCLNLFSGDYIAGSQYGMLSPNGTCGVFDSSANGFTRGEGVGVIVLKRLEDARKTNSRVYGVIKGCHQNNRGGARNISEIKHESITEVIKNCWSKVSIPLETVNYIEVDGYSTKWGDSFEFDGIKNAFKGCDIAAKTCALGSVKGNIGHLEPASGIASVIKVALSLYNKRFPATITKKKLNEFIDIDSPVHPLYIADEEVQFNNIRQDNCTPIRAGVNSFADSGVNVHILLEEDMQGSSEANSTSDPRQEIFVLSAKSYDRLREYVHVFIDYLSGPGSKIPFASINYSLQVGREALDDRLAVIAASHEELVGKLKLFIESDPGSARDRGIYYGNSLDSTTNPLFGLITEEMTDKQLEVSLGSGRWEQIALLWSNGANISWQKIWRDRGVQYVSLPGYPFSKDKYWFGISNQEDTAGSDMVRNARRLNAGAGVSAKPDYLAPRNEIEKKLVAIWSDLLNLDSTSISINDDFLELGGDSIKAMSLVSRLNAQFSQSLPLDVLFSASTISDLAKIVEHSDPSSSEIIVPIQIQGNRSPIFAVPGFEGHVLALRPLSMALGAEQPFYGLQALGLDGKSKPLETVEKIADANIAAIGKQKKNGAMILLGYSNGGVVAYEMARKLLSRGAKIKSLILLDTPEPQQHTYDELGEVTRFLDQINSLYGNKFEYNADKLREVPTNERSDFLYGIAKNGGVDIDKKHFDMHYRVAMTSESCVRKYKTKKLTRKLDVYLFKATEGSADLPHDYGWNKYLLKPVEIFDLKANHFSLVTDTHVSEIASIINERIK